MDTSREVSPQVTIIIVNYKMANYLRHLLKTIEHASPSFTYECFIVDNDSHDNIADIIQTSHPWVKLIKSTRNVGLGAGANIALPHASGKYILFLNPDLIIEPGQLDAWLVWMEQHSDVGVSGPRLLNTDGSDQESCYHFPQPLIPLLRRTPLGNLPFAKKMVAAYRLDGLDRTQEHDVDWVLGAAMLMRRDALEQIGRFDERFFLYFEDADVCRRIWKIGQRVVYTPVAHITHYYQRQSYAPTLWQALRNPITRIHIHSGIKYFLKYFGEPNPHVSSL